MSLYSISYITACMNRLHHIKETLAHNLRNLGQNAEIILLDYNSTDGLKEYILLHHQDDIEQRKLKYFHTTEPEYFHHSHSRNVLALASVNDILCVLDVDNFLMAGFTNHLQENFAIDGPKLIGYCDEHGAFHGRMAVMRKYWIELRGFDEDMRGWGWEDNDFRKRAMKIPLRTFAFDETLLANVIEPTVGDRTRCLPQELHDYMMTNERNKKLFELRMKRGEITANIGRPWGVATLYDHQNTKLVTGHP